MFLIVILTLWLINNGNNKQQILLDLQKLRFIFHITVIRTHLISLATLTVYLRT